MIPSLACILKPLCIILLFLLNFSLLILKTFLNSLGERYCSRLEQSIPNVFGTVVSYRYEKNSPLGSSSSDSSFFFYFLFFFFFGFGGGESLSESEELSFGVGGFFTFSAFLEAFFLTTRSFELDDEESLLVSLLFSSD